MQSRLDVPVGTILDYAGSSVPDGYLECDGSAVSRTAYPKLFAAIGTAWGAGNGSSTFNLPNLGGRAAIGRGSRSVGNTGGSETHTLTISEMPSHDHTVNSSGAVTNGITGGSHRHSFTIPLHAGANVTGSGAIQLSKTMDSTYTANDSNNNYVQSREHTHSLPNHTHTMKSTGGVSSQHHAALRRRAKGHTRRIEAVV